DLLLGSFLGRLRRHGDLRQAPEKKTDRIAATTSRTVTVFTDPNQPLYAWPMTQMDRHELTRKRVRYEAPGMGEVAIRRQVEYAPGANHTLDVYYPPGWTAGDTAPAVIVVSGLSDVGAQQFLGCRINEMASFISWGRLLAASGLIGITHTTGTNAADDVRTALRQIVASGAALGVDPHRIGLLAFSSHVPNALGLLMAEPGAIACAVLAYG